MKLASLLTLSFTIFYSLFTFSMGADPPPPPEPKPEHVESCVYFSRIEFRRAYPNHNIIEITYKPDPVAIDTLEVTVRGKNPQACSNLPPEVIYCNDFGQSIRVTCFEGEVIDIF